MSKEDTCFSRGSILAKLMIVGQSPGKDEATRMYDDPKTNRSVRIPVPFCGVAGILLMSFLRAVDIREGDYIMTNAVSFYPTDNEDKLRPPTQQEVEMERDRLIMEVLTIRPKVILAFGIEAMWDLVYYHDRPLSAVKSLSNHGQIAERTFEYPGFQEHTCKIIMLFHPSYLRRKEVSGDRDVGEARTQFLEAFITHKEEIEDAIGRVLLISR